MTSHQSGRCRMEGCNQEVPSSLREDGYCLDHFVDGTYLRARRAVEATQRELPLETDAFEWMFEDAKMALKALVRDSDEPYREGVMELITTLANVHEYLRQQTGKSVSTQAPGVETMAGQSISRSAAIGRNA